MASFNKLIVMGNLTRDPELTFTPSNVPICKGGIAMNDKYTTKDGEKREEVCFLDYVLFGKQAETFNTYMQKGKPVLLEGSLKLDQWETEDGQKRSKHNMKVDRFTFVAEAPQQSAATPVAAAPADTPF